MNKWVCVVDDLDGFEYSKTYVMEEISDDLLFIKNKAGNIKQIVSKKVLKEVVNYKHAIRTYGAPQIEITQFVTLEEWRDEVINKIIS